MTRPDPSIYDAEEDAADAAIYAERKAALDRGEDSILPEVSAEIHRGSSRLKAIRRWRGKSQIEVAEAVGIAQSYLSSLEAGSGLMTDDLVERFATALDVPKAWVSP